MRTRLVVLAMMFALNPVFASGKNDSENRSANKAKCEQRIKEENAKCAAK